LGLVHSDWSPVFHVGNGFLRLAEHDVIRHDQRGGKLLRLGELARVNDHLPGIGRRIGESGERCGHDSRQACQRSRIENVTVRRRIRFRHRVEVFRAEAGLTSVSRREVKHRAVIHHHAIGVDRSGCRVGRLDRPACPVIDEARRDVGRRRSNVDRCHDGSNDVGDERSVDSRFEWVACRRESAEVPHIVEHSTLRARRGNRTVVDDFCNE